MNRRESRDPVADPLLEALLNDLRSDVPQDVDWGQLRRAINGRAEPALARRRRRSIGWITRRSVPLAAAASVALALWAGPALLDRAGDRGARIAGEMDSDAILREALGSDLTDQEFQNLVTGRAYPEVLLAVAVEGQ